MILIIASVILMIVIVLVIASAAGTLLGFGSIAKQRAQRSKGKVLAKRLGELGNLVGRPKSFFVEMLGQPVSSVTKGGNRVALIWGWPGYAIALLFEGETCQGVLYEQLDR